MGDVRYSAHLARVRDAPDPVAEMKALPDEGVIAALAAASQEGDPYWANVLATEAMNRTRQKTAISETLGEGVYALDEAGRITWVNAAAETMLGWRRDELLGRDMHDLVHARHADGSVTPRDECRILGVLRSGKTAHVDDDAFRRKDGAPFPAAYTASAILRDGVVEGAVVVFRDVTERRRAADALVRRVELEATIASVSSRFVGDDLDAAIAGTLEDVGRLTRADRAYVFAIRPDGVLMDNTHEWCADGVEPQIHALRGLPCDAFPWWMGRLRAGERIHVADVATLPPEAAAERAVLESQAIRSALALPVRVGGALWGFVGLDNVRRAEAWSDADVNVLSVAAEILGSAIGRHRAELRLQQRMRELTALHEMSDAVARAADLDEVCRAAIDGIRSALAAERASILVFDDAGVMRFRAWHGLSDAYRAAVDGHSPWSPDEKDARPILVPDVERDASLAPYLKTFQAERVRALAFIPLAHRGRLLGKFMIYHAEPHAFTDDEVRLAETIGASVAFAIERRRTEEDLRRSLGLLRAVTEGTADAVFLKDERGRYAFMNRACAALFDLAPEDAVGLDDEALLGPEAAARIRAVDERVLRTGATVTEDDRVTIRGAPRVFQSTKTPLRERDGRITGVIGIARDVTEREAAAERLALYRKVLASSNDAIAIIAPDGTYLEQNAAHRALTGYSDDELAGRTPAIHLGDATFAAIAAELAREGRYRGECVSRSKDGRETHVDLAAFTLRNDRGEVVCHVGIKRDVGERRRVEAALRESEERFRLLARATSDTIWDWDLRSDALWWNENFGRTFGYPPEEAGSHIRSWTSRIHPDDAARVEAGVRAAIAGAAETWSDEYRFRRRDGAYAHVLDRGLVIRDADGRAVRMVGSMMDVTDRKRAEERARQLAAELERRVEERTRQLAVANAELEAFSYSVSHDLRSPVRAIDYLASALLEDHGRELPEGAVEYLRRLRSESRSMAQLIHDLLALSRATRGAVADEDVDLSGLARGVLDELAKREPTRRVETRVEDGLRAPGDPRLLKLALENLLGNAWKFTAKRPDAVIEFFAAHSDDGGKRFVVRDNGAGFPPERAERLFRPFQRLHADEDFEGTGVGLATVRRIVERHGGRVGAEGRPGEGASFWFTL